MINKTEKFIAFFPVFSMKTYALRAAEAGKENRVKICFIGGGTIS